MKKNKFHLHVMQYNNKRYIEQLIFRDSLRSNLKLAKAYEAYKLFLMNDDLAWYSMGKLGFLDKFFGRKSEFEMLC